MSAELPPDVSEIHVEGEIKPGDPGIWAPQSFAEWRNTARVKAVLAEWSEQEREERELRSRVATWVFSLIGLQLILVFAILFLQGISALDLDIQIVKVFFPSVFVEITGLGFVVVKYLFGPTRSGDSRDMIKGLEDGS